MVQIDTWHVTARMLDSPVILTAYGLTETQARETGAKLGPLCSTVTIAHVTKGPGRAKWNRKEFLIK